MDDDKTRTHIVLSADTAVSHYKIINKIGAGGMGEVYLAEDTSLHRKVALKLLAGHLCQDEDLRKRFVREAEAAAQLNHPNIITIHEVGDFRGRPFFAMEHVEGQSLKELFKSRKVTVTEAIELSIQILDGLKSAHEHGVTHRDIKPSNILIDSYGRPKILDFGLAAVTGSEPLTKTGSTMGTVQYMSPEQIQGEKVGAPSDLFSFGVVLYQMLAGKLPFTGEYEAAVVYSITSEDPPSIRDQRPDIPAELENLVFKLLEKDSELRYQTATGVMADMRRFAQTGSQKIRTRSGPVKRHKRNYWLPASLAFIAVIAIVLFGPWKFNLSSKYDDIPVENRIAIMYFDNMIDPTDTYRLGEMITTLLITDLCESESVNVMSSQRLYDILKQLGREGQKTIDRDGASEIARKAKCRLMLLGAILQTEPNIVATSHLIDVESGTTIASQRVDGAPGAAVTTIVDSLTRQVRKDLSLPDSGLEEDDKPIAEATTGSAEAYRHYLEGREFQFKHLWQDAEKSYRKAITLDSTFAMALCRLGWVIRGQDGFTKVEAAMRYTDKLTKRERLHIQSRYYLLTRNWDQAREVLGQTVDAYPDDKEAGFDLAGILAEVGLIDSSITLIEHVIDLDPFWAQAYNQIAYYYDTEGRSEDAIWAINQTIRLDPDGPNAYDSRGEILAINSQLDSSKQSYLRALEVLPDFVSSNARMGELLALERKYDSASIYFRKQLRTDDKALRSYGRSNTCSMLILQGRLRHALERSCMAEEQDMLDGVDAVEQRVWQATIFSELTTDVDAIAGRWDSVFALCNRTYPKWVPSEQYLFCISSMIESGSAESAGKTMETWESREGFDPYHVHIAARGILEFGQGNFEHATSLMDSSLIYVSMRTGWSYFLYNYWLGRSCFASEDYDRAIDVFGNLTTVYSQGRFYCPLESVKLHYYLGQLYEVTGQVEKAIEQYEELLLWWEDADPELGMLEDTQQRLGKLKSTS